METILFLACIAEKQTVLTTKAWTSFHKKRKMAFRDRLMSVDLGKLRETAAELKWFPTDLDYLKLHENEPEWKDLMEEFPEFLDTPASMIEKSVDLRNLIHPARCLRENRSIDERGGQVALGLFYMSLLGLMYNLGRDMLEPGSRKLVIRYSPQVKRLQAARKEMASLVAENPSPQEAAQRILTSVEATKGLLELMAPTLHDIQNSEA